MALRDEWNGFNGGHWVDDINVRDFIQRNYTAYDGDDSFLAGPTDATDKLWGKVQELQAAERANNGVLECETEIVSGLTAYGAGYIGEGMKDLEQVVGLQTDKPLKRASCPTAASRWPSRLPRTTASMCQRQVQPDLQRVPQDPQPGRL